MIGQTTERGKEERRAFRQRKAGATERRQPPDFVIIGAQKGGTTSLYRYLTEHPDVGGATKKEVHFFDRSYDKGLDWYLAHFPERGEFAVVGESGPSYLFHPEVPERVRRTLPHAKLLVLLRNPVDRAYSQYQMRLRRVGEDSFEAALDEEFARLPVNGNLPGPEKGHHAYLPRGVYADQLRRWFAVFPREQFLVLQSEAFFAQPEEGLRRTLAFLGLPPWRPAEFEVHNPGAYGEMRPETRRRLQEFYAPHNRRLYELLDWDLGWDDV
ncbi:MAG: sulfotransferase domain-containing protein [Chloroflexota bacterium]|nr:sulfotransferase domain-containing protein [Chloroflexota bacterium]